MDNNCNTGNWNTGDCNTGDCNTGDYNTGDWNTGYLNTGNRNTGNWNTGNWNTGNWNTGNWNTGYLNTGNGKVEIFGKPTNISRSELEFPDFFDHETAAVWVPSSEMALHEKHNHTEHEVVGGYLKKVSPKAGWRTAWDNATDEDRRKCLEIPNWNNEMFLEITGIDVEAELASQDTEEMTMEEVCKALGKTVKIIKEK